MSFLLQVCVREFRDQEGVAPRFRDAKTAEPTVYLVRKQTRNDTQLPSLAERPLAGKGSTSVEKPLHVGEVCAKYSEICGLAQQS